MNVELDWRAADEDGVWETVAAYRTRHGWDVPRWAWIATCVALLVTSAASYLLVRQRYTRAIRQITFQVQSVIDLEASAVEERNIGLYLRQQDRAQREWMAEQVERVEAGIPQCTARAVPAFARYDECPPVQAPQVQQVEMRGDVAWVEVIDDHTRVRKARFYRQTDVGWQHTAPCATFWGSAIEHRTDRVVIRYSEQEGPYMGVLLTHIERVIADVDAGLPERTYGPLHVDFTGIRLGDLPALSHNRLTLASPWLSGIPVDGRWDETGEGSPYLDLLRYWVAYARTAQYLSGQVDISGSDAAFYPAPLTKLSAAIAGEYATAYSEGNLVQTPILRRIAAQHGSDALAAVLRAVASGSPSVTFAERWLSIPTSSTDAAFLEPLLEIEREAAQLRQGGTFQWIGMLLSTCSGRGVDWGGDTT